LGTAVGHIRRSADDLARARAEGDRLARLTAVGALGSAIAHELSQPLFAIRTASHVLMRGLERGGGTGEMLRAARTIESQIEQASARIRALRAEFQSAGPLPSVFDLVVAARQAARIVDGGAAMARGQLTVEESLPVRVRADRAHVAYILDNLFRNALAAIRTRGAGGRVRVIFGAADDIVRVEVVDNGVGISEDLAGRLFEPMVTGRHDGVGLGLFIGRTLAELNEGALSHRTTFGGGATFVLELPAGAKP
jgi:two-component system sensor kinase FixL